MKTRVFCERKLESDWCKVEDSVHAGVEGGRLDVSSPDQQLWAILHM